MVGFLCVLAVLCFMLMAGSKRQEDRNNHTMAFCVLIIAIMFLYFK